MNSAPRLAGIPAAKKPMALSPAAIQRGLFLFLCLVWGTNWPHNLARVQADYPDDADLADTVLGWLSDDAARKRALVDNPEELFGIPPAGGR